MSDFSVIRPEDDNVARQTSGWCDELIRKFTANGHRLADDVNQWTPADQASMVARMGGTTDLICYFGHGETDCWLTNGTATIDANTIHHAAGKAVISIACDTACNFGPDAITAGVVAWLGFTILVAVMAPHKNQDPIGEAIVDGLELLGNGRTMQEARDEIAANLDQLVVRFHSGGSLASHPAAAFGYYASMAMRDHVVVHGQANHVPL